ncbi:phage tail protein [Bacillus sp. 166amftsu]|uniref:phage tail protein n=1 Tax=Bacillus sp. 166amftsu TaxID=1761753 RepID=UPI00089D5453|nr:phage tail protein [Bacillus sp. 166amftsu]SDY42773.1 Phage-related protein [Bacillus sp. 166amftsu]
MLDIRIDDYFASDFNMCMVERPKIPTAKREVEYIKVPGRHGSLTKKGAFEDVPLTIKFNLLEDENAKPLIRRIKSWLLNGKVLHFDDDVVYRKIKNVEIDDIENQIEEYGGFEATFTFDPFEYVEDETIILTTPGVLYNPGTEKSDPKIVIAGSGTVNITINDVTFQVKDIVDSVIIDSELLEAYKGTTNMNNKMIGNFPVFDVENNSITWTGTVQSLTITPRWRYI